MRCPQCRVAGARRGSGRSHLALVAAILFGVGALVLLDVSLLALRNVPALDQAPLIPIEWMRVLGLSSLLSAVLLGFGALRFLARHRAPGRRGRCTECGARLAAPLPHRADADPPHPLTA